MQKVLFYINNNLSKEIDLSKIGIRIRKLNEIEYNDLLDGFNGIILKGKDLELANEFYLFKNGLKKLSDDEEINLIRTITKSKNQNTIFNIYNGFNKDVSDILTVKNIKNELNNFLLVEIDDEEFNKHFYENYIYDLIPKIINFCNYMASDDGDYKEYGQCKMYKYNGTKVDKDLIGVLFIMILTYKDNCSIDNKYLIKLEDMFKKKIKSLILVL